MFSFYEIYRKHVLFMEVILSLIILNKYNYYIIILKSLILNESCKIFLEMISKVNLIHSDIIKT